MSKPLQQPLRPVAAVAASTPGTKVRASPRPPSRGPAPLAPKTGGFPPVSRAPLRTGRRLRPGWPLSVIVLLFPLWWLLGLGALIFPIMAVPMAVQLARRSRISVPRGFGFWLLFLAWMLVGVVLLWADAPGAVPGGGPQRLLIFGYRAGWYLAATIVLLYLGNLTEEELPTRRVIDLLGLMFVFTVAGGLLGTLAPDLELRSLMETLLPDNVSQIPLLRDAIRPQIAHVQAFLGYEQPRPVAPFAYANAWGAAVATFLPFFVLSWFRSGAGWRRLVAPLILIVALRPIVFSLDRGLWIGLILMGAWTLFRLVAMGRTWIIKYLVVGLAIGGLIFVQSPLLDLLKTRLETPHSNYRRMLLYERTVDSTFEGSPFLGFGSTRDVPGNLISIAEGARPGCIGCGAPPLGTQGHLWFLIFAHGFVGALFFILFFTVRFFRHWRERAAVAVACTAVMLCFAWFLPIYDLVEVPLYTLMIVVALLWRHQRGSPPDAGAGRAGVVAEEGAR